MVRTRVPSQARRSCTRPRPLGGGPPCSAPHAWSSRSAFSQGCSSAHARSCHLTCLTCLTSGACSNIRGGGACSSKLVIQTSRDEETGQWCTASCTPAGGLQVPECPARGRGWGRRQRDGAWRGQMMPAGKALRLKSSKIEGEMKGES